MVGATLTHHARVGAPSDGNSIPERQRHTVRVRCHHQARSPTTILLSASAAETDLASVTHPIPAARVPRSFSSQRQSRDRTVAPWTIINGAAISFLPKPDNDSTSHPNPTVLTAISRKFSNP